MKLKDERHQYILDQIEQKRIARVLDLSKDLNVAEMTIRRDLKELESQGYLQRIHGGAKALSSPNPTIYKEQSRQDKKAMNTAAKKIIAQKCSTLIHDVVDDNEEVVFIGSGTTNEAIFDYIKEKRLTIVTNSMDIFMQYKGLAHIDTYLVGGRYREKTGTFVGQYAENMIRQFEITKAFIGANGIVNQEITTANEAEGACHQVIIETAEQVYINADRTKFDVKALFTFATLNQVTAVITDDVAKIEQNPMFFI
ncbi:DeoR family transcriptional regulator [Mammaliicoccus fleurettii]|uniref:Lactose phosphotransferase system repressor n=1 Tax=Staphylococcus schleiferi TaxID=1295 RepID=A0ABX0FYH5_STASC|nr:DeoR/GlpR family DNA-binding transcription regulator [Staphylococcus schleiferi]NHA33733.1 DeoR family transcriptional regulator [Staphylococcus schleiferi]QGS45304.1 DeoR family transcriptional regulator [Mammaliicoccus fleurettii]